MVLKTDIIHEMCNEVFWFSLLHLNTFNTITCGFQIDYYFAI